MKLIFLGCIMLSASLFANDLCFREAKAEFIHEPVIKSTVTLSPIPCEDRAAVRKQNESIAFQINVPKDVSAYKIRISHPYENLEEDYLKGVIMNILGVFKDPEGDVYLWVIPSTRVEIKIPVDEARLYFGPNIFSLEVQPYLWIE